MKKRIIISLFVLMFLSVAIALPAVSASAERVQTLIAGSWAGTYYYQDDRPGVDFRGDINRQGNQIWGNLVEPRTFGSNEAFLYSTISGLVDGNTVSFVKTYAYDSTHTVAYMGTYYPKERIIRGCWYIGEESGPFEITISN